VKKNNLFIGLSFLVVMLTLFLSLPTPAATAKNETLSVIGRAPAITSIQPDNFTPRVGDRVTVSVITADPDGDSVTPQYQWQLDDVNIPGAIQNNYLIAPGQGGDRHLKVMVTPLTEPTQTEPSIGGSVTSAVMITGADLPDGIQSSLDLSPIAYQGRITLVTVTMKDRTGKPAIITGPLTLESNVPGVTFDKPQHCDGRSSVCSMQMSTNTTVQPGNILLTVKMNGMTVTGLSKTVEVRKLQFASTSIHPQTVIMSPLNTFPLVVTVVDNTGTPVSGISVAVMDGAFGNGTRYITTDSQGKIYYTPSFSWFGMISLITASIPEETIEVASVQYLQN
jgi:hypothetical protein